MQARAGDKGYNAGLRRGVWAACLCCWLQAACAPAPTPRAVDQGPRTERVYVVAGGWHTEIALPAASIGAPLSGLKPAFPGARYLVFGWGARDYYMARDPGINDLLRALTPGPAVMLVIPLAVPPAAFAGEVNTFALSVSAAGLARLAHFLWDDLAKKADGNPLAVGSGPYAGSVFYASAGTYDLSHTCNTWTAEALAAAGVPVRAAGVVFAGQLLDQLRPIVSPGG